MTRTMRRIRRDESGFTLIELLIVILILGILAGIAIFASAPFRQRAADACAEANARIQIVADAAVDAGVSSDGMFEAAPGDCAGGNPGGGGGDLEATFVDGITNDSDVTADAGDLLVAIASHRTLDDGVFPGTPSAPGYTLQGTSSFKTTGITSDRRAVAVFTRIADGTAADDFSPTFGATEEVHTIVQRFTVSSTPSFAFSATGGDGTETDTLALTGSGDFMVVGLTSRDDGADNSVSWSGAGNATSTAASTMFSSMASGAGGSATATLGEAHHVSGFVLNING